MSTGRPSNYCKYQIFNNRKSHALFMNLFVQFLLQRSHIWNLCHSAIPEVPLLTNIIFSKRWEHWMSQTCKCWYSCHVRVILCPNHLSQGESQGGWGLIPEANLLPRVLSNKCYIIHWTSAHCAKCLCARQSPAWKRACAYAFFCQIP